jgi:ClpP class serine protease
MIITYKSRWGILKYKQITADMGYTTADDYEIALKALDSFFKDFVKLVKEKR